MTEDPATDIDDTDDGTETADTTGATLSSDYKVKGETSATDGTGVLGHNTATNGVSSGVEGVTESDDTDAAGVFGASTASSGTTVETFGVHGVSAADGTLKVDPAGVKGTGTGTGENAGVLGVTESTAGRAAGVQAKATTGSATGIIAESAGGMGIEVTTGGAGKHAVWARQTGSKGTTSDHAIVGEAYTKADGVAGVVGKSGYGSSTQAYGVRGKTESTGNGTAGVRGEATKVSGQTYGVEGITRSPRAGAAGVRGEATQASGSTYGVKGITNSDNGGVFSDASGVHGDAPGSSGAQYGVRGTTSSPGLFDSFLSIPVYSAGVRGEATASSGSNYSAGVHGVSSSLGASGVRADAYSGTAMEVKGVSENTTASPAPSEHASHIIDTSSTYSSVLSLQAGYTASTNTYYHNFLTFYDTTGSAVGAIENDGNGGVKFSSGGSDYAEYLPHRYPDEEMEAGDVVGVVDGAVTKRTTEADQAMVVSGDAIVSGNAPEQSPEPEAEYEQIAFVGQIPVKVRGPVDAGDLVVPSGHEDGIGEAIPAGAWQPGDGPIVGRAWESTDDEAVDAVTVAVGLDTGEALEPAIATHRARIDGLEPDVEQFQEALAAKTERIEDLETANRRLRDRVSELEAERERDADRIDALEDRLRTLEGQVGTASQPADD